MDRLQPTPIEIKEARLDAKIALGLLDGLIDNINDGKQLPVSLSARRSLTMIKLHLEDAIFQLEIETSKTK